jgi:hypothetical protein
MGEGALVVADVAGSLAVLAGRSFVFLFEVTKSWFEIIETAILVHPAELSCRVENVT